MDPVVVVGAGPAGLSLVTRLRTLQYGGRITLIGAEPVLPYQRPPLSKSYLMGELDVERLYLRPSSFFTDQEITFLSGVIVSYLSQFVSLQPGDIISTGTPPGVGMGMKPTAIYLKPGDTMELGVEGLGLQNQEVVQG